MVYTDIKSAINSEYYQNNQYILGVYINIPYQSNNVMDKYININDSNNNNIINDAANTYPENVD